LGFPFPGFRRLSSRRTDPPTRVLDRWHHQQPDVDSVADALIHRHPTARRCPRLSSPRRLSSRRTDPPTPH